MTSKSLPKFKPTLWDGLVALVIIALAIVVAISVYGGKSGSGALTCVITDHGQEITQVDMTVLDDVEYLQIDGEYHLTVKLSPDGVEVTDSDCPHQDCVHTAPISRAGQSIVCLPGQIVITLVGTPAADTPDVIVG